MKILHTSDWHLGRSLYGRKRYDEFESFLNWLAELLESENIDLLLVAGDVFDTGVPGNRAQELYYRFLRSAAGNGRRHVIIVAGNHDSPSFLEAPKELLGFLNIRVVGSVSQNLEDEVIILKDQNDVPQLIVCAVPYLRERDIRTVEAGESIEDKERKLVKGARDHYHKVCAIAEEKLKEMEKPVPIAATGHLFAAGGKSVDGDGVRELYIGSLAGLAEDVFPSRIDYLALGHLHLPQKVGKSEKIRYCGSPIPMGFGEAKKEKKVLVVEFQGRAPIINEKTIPRFQELESISGDADAILSRVEELKAVDSKAWLEIEYEGSESSGKLRNILDEAVAGSAIEIRRVKNKRVFDSIIDRISRAETLEDLNEEDVFLRLLEADDTTEEHRTELLASYREILISIHEEDANKE